MTKLCTISGKVPFGSPLSPILCFHVHRWLFDEIARLCAEHGLILTLYVDDIAISGSAVPGPLLFEIKKLIRRAGHRYHKVRRTSSNGRPVITGVRLTPTGPSPVNRKHLELKAGLDQLDGVADHAARLALLQKMVGLNQHFIQVLDQHHPARGRAESRQAWLRNELHSLRKLPVCTTSTVAMPINIYDHSCPFDRPPSTGVDS